MFGDSPGHIAGYGAIGCSLLAVAINFMCVPMLMNQVAMLRENLQVDMDEFKVISDTAWDKMVDLRRTLETKNLRFTRQADAKESGEKRTTRASGEFKSRWWGHSTPQGQGWTGDWEQQWPTDQPWLAQNDGFVDSSCPPGQPGMPGAAGQDGQNGAKGADGEAGLDGNGLDGPIGEDGCIICPQGPQGAPGPIGPQGAPGEKGWPGIDGNPGSDGWPGPIGPRGFRGQEGVPGKRGIKGLPGKPAPGGKGEPGPKGAAGPIGRAGPQGPPGKPGYKAGPQGPQGKKGPKGVDGTPASDGERGPIGPTGFPGGDAKYCPCPKEITNTQQARPTAIPGPNQGWGSTRWNGPTPPYQQGWTDNVWGASPGWNAPGNQGDWWSGVDGK